MDSQISLKEVKGLFRRRYKGFLSVFSLMFLSAIVLGLALPPIFQSQTMIMIEEQQIPQDFVKSTITTYAEQRLEMITREIMRYSQLKEIILKFNLYPEMVLKNDMSSAVEKLKDSILVENISTKQGDQLSTVAFTLAYEGKDPETVQKVTEAIAQQYLNKELQAREKLASVTTNFLKQELENLKQQVSKQEERISAYKTKHMGELPENMAMNIQNITSLERDLDSINARIRTLEDRKIYLRGQLAYIEPLRPIQTEQGQFASNPKERLKTLRLELIQMQSRLSENHPDVRKVKSEIAKLEQQVGKTDTSVEKIRLLQERKAKLAEAKGRLGPMHPDVIALTKEVKALSKEVDKLLTDKSVLQVSEDRPDNPAYINLLTQVNSAESEIRSLKDQQQSIEKSLEKLRLKIANSPSIEKEYGDLTLDYANAKGKYNELLNKLMTAEVSQQMEVEQKGEKFSILEPAFLPTRAYKPNRIAIILLGFVLACGAAAGMVAIQESMDHSVKSEEELFRATGVPVLSTLALVKTPEEKRAKRLRTAAYVFGTIGVVVVVLLLVNTFAMPLNELLATIVNRMAT